MKCPTCGADLTAKDRFCSACGTRRPRFAAPFENAASQYAALHAGHHAGQLDAAAYEAAILRLAVQDEAGSYWSPGADSGEWYRYEGSQWVRRDPPLAGVTPRPDTPPRSAAPTQSPGSSAVAAAAERPRASLLPGLLLVLGWSGGWLAGYGLALVTHVLFQPSAKLALDVTAAGIVSGAIAALVSRPGRNRSSPARAALTGAVWAVAWAIGWLAAWAVGAFSAREFADSFYSLALSLESPLATAAVLWLHIYGLAGLAAGIVAGSVAALILPRPERGCSPMARLGFLIFWPGLWVIGWVGGGSLQAALLSGMDLSSGEVQAFSLVGGAIGGALLAGVVLRIFNRPGVGQSSARQSQKGTASA